MNRVAAPEESLTFWASRRERGALVMMWLMFHGVKLLSRPLAMPFIYLSTAYFFIFGRGARAASKDYLARVAAAAPDRGIDAGPMDVYRHFVSFARAIVDKQNAWLGRIDYSQVGIEDHARMRVLTQSARGVLLIGSHLGNLELCRALATLNRRVRLNVLVHTRHSKSFNQVLRMAGATQVELIQVTELSAATALMLKARIDQGEWVVIAGDRVPVHGGRTVDVQLLGASAPVPVGPYVLASVLECPVHLLFCLRRPDRLPRVLRTLLHSGSLAAFAAGCNHCRSCPTFCRPSGVLPADGAHAMVQLLSLLA